MERRWSCPTCGAVMDEPVRRFEPDDGAVATVGRLCPRCGAGEVEELEPCPVCRGWRRRGEGVCPDCRQRHREALGRFARMFSPAELADLDDLLEGSGLELFV